MSAETLTATGYVDLLTVAAGKRFVPLTLDRYVDSATAMNVAETVSVGTDSDADAVCAATALSSVGAGAIDRLTLPPAAIAAGAKLRVTRTVAATASAASGRYFITGYYINA